MSQESVGGAGAARAAGTAGAPDGDLDEGETRNLARRSDSPMRTAPRISATVAMQQACRSVSTLAPTLVPKTLATSFAPTPKERMKARTKPRMIIQSVDECHSASDEDPGASGASVVVVVISKPGVSARQDNTTANTNVTTKAARMAL